MTKISPSALQPPSLLWPDMQVFVARAARFEQLGQITGSWQQLLQQMAQLTEQQAKLRVQAAELAAHHPNLTVADVPHDAVVAQLYQQLIAGLSAECCAMFATTPQQLKSLTVAQINQLAVAVTRAGSAIAEQYLSSVAVILALQLIYTAQAVQHSDEDMPVSNKQNECFFCQQVAGVEMIKTAALENLGYMYCSWCNCQWNVLRVNCINCGGSDKISQQRVKDQDDGLLAAARAQTCDNCFSYKKLLLQTVDSKVDAVADDLATMALDLAVLADKKYQRNGLNLLFPTT